MIFRVFIFFCFFFPILKGFSLEKKLESHITISGKLDLPSLPLHTLIGNALHPDLSLDQAQFRKEINSKIREFNYAGEKPNLSHYPALNPSDNFSYSSFFEVLARPLKGPHREQRDFSNPDLAERPYYRGKIDDKGNFEISVPAHPGEYLVVIQSEKAIFKTLVISSGMPGFVISGQRVNLQTTLETDLNLWLEYFGVFLPQKKILKNFRETLKEHLILYETDLRSGKFKQRDHTLYGLMALSRALEIHLKRKRFDDPKLPLAQGRPEYNLSFLGSPQKLQALLSRIWEELRNRENPEVNLFSSSEIKNAQMLGISPAILENAQIISFPPKTRSFGVMIESLGSRPRALPFEMRVYSQYAELLGVYRWWTLGQGTGFYGISSPQEIGFVEIQTSFINQLKISEIIYGGEYLGQKGNFWRATGAWKLVDTKFDEILSINRKRHRGSNWVFDHYWRQATSPMRVEGKCTFEFNHSGGSFYQYLASGNRQKEESYLISPLIQLTHLPLEEEDLQSAKEGNFSSWISGTWKGLNETYYLPGSPPCSEFTRTITKNALNRSFGEAGFQKSQFRDLPRQTHWAHLHFQSRLVGMESKNMDHFGVQYSLDNGNSWQKAWWYKDEYHRGQNLRWWGAEIDLYADSDLANRDALLVCSGTDFNQDGKSDFFFDIGGDGRINDKDCRVWDTRFFIYPQRGNLGIPLTNAPERIVSLVPGASLLLRFYANVTEEPDQKHPFIWEIDDVSINGDMEELGYFTDFDWEHFSWE